MTVMSERKIAGEIEAYITKSGSPNADWYVGIAAVPRERLFKEHSLHEKGDLWIYREAESATSARKVEQYFIESLNTNGGGGGGGANTKYVYAYRKNSHTNP